MDNERVLYILKRLKMEEKKQKSNMDKTEEDREKRIKDIGILKAKLRGFQSAGMSPQLVINRISDIRNIKEYMDKELASLDRLRRNFEELTEISEKYMSDVVIFKEAARLYALGCKDKFFNIIDALEKGIEDLKSKL